MSTSQNHCHRLSVTKPKIWLLIKQILSSKVLLVTSKEEAPDILNSGTATMFEPHNTVLSDSEGEI